MICLFRKIVTEGLSVHVNFYSGYYGHGKVRHVCKINKKAIIMYIQSNSEIKNPK